jgi:predicted house-cleaning noncanonical NTP pyrophosphatase (MazG superfamily)
MRTAYNKLVRDRIPEIIEQNGDRAVTYVLDDDRFLAELLAKLVEESQEAQRASASELLFELADVLECCRRFCRPWTSPGKS